MSTQIMARLPRVLVEKDFLSPSDHARLLEESLQSEAAYKPSSIFSYDDERGDLSVGKDAKVRKSVARPLSKDQSKLFKESVTARANRIADEIGVKIPEQRKFEIEAVQNGDGAFFSTHIDTTRGSLATGRVISAVYYYSKTPQAFSGGGLKLYSLDRSGSITIAPDDNTIVFFSSIFPHEVLPVAVPSGAFEDGRFSVNCWVHKLV